MAERHNYAIFIDLENCGGKVETLTDVIEKVKMRGDILLSKVYGYNEQYAELKELLLSNTFNVVPSLRWGYNQKNNLDIQLVIDALEVAYRNELIDCFCIVSGDSDYTPLVGKLKSMGKFILGISRSEIASKVFINACNEFVFLETVSSLTDKRRGRRERVSKRDRDTSANNALEDVNNLMERILREQIGTQEEGFLYASELKKTLTRLKPDFNEKDYGCSSFGKLVKMVSKKYSTVRILEDNNVMKVGLASEEAKTEEGTAGNITANNWQTAIGDILAEFKAEGFDRLNPSIIKAAIQSEYPTFDEKQIGFNRFSDLMKELEKTKKVKIEFDETHSMLLRIM